jgi:hypothetical protein
MKGNHQPNKNVEHPTSIAKHRMEKLNSVSGFAWSLRDPGKLLSPFFQFLSVKSA